jgi:hypothetical protein
VVVKWSVLARYYDVKVRICMKWEVKIVRN